MAGNDGWMWQGRQHHQWFGHGTKPKDGAATKSAAGDLAARIHGLGHTLVASLPRPQRHHAALRMDAQDHARLDRVLVAIVGGLRATATSFAAHFFAAPPDAPYVGPFREAARLVAAAETQADLRDASDALAGAATAVGLDRWRGFLRAVDEQLAGTPAPLVVLARAPGPVQPLGDLAGSARPAPNGEGGGKSVTLAAAIFAALIGVTVANVRRDDIRTVAERFGLDLDKRAGQEAAAAYLYLRNGNAAMLAHLGADTVDREGPAEALL